MNIKELSEISGLTTHTLRYYEKIGLLKNIKRDSVGYRDYTENDAAWIEFIGRLKATGMSIENNVSKLFDNLKKNDEKINIYKNYIDLELTPSFILY